MSTFGA
jgi:hypothetical protein